MLVIGRKRLVIWRWYLGKAAALQPRGQPHADAQDQPAAG